MIIFNNRDRPNYLQVKEMGPKWLAEFLEMDVNYQYAGWTLDLMAYWMEHIVLNIFPQYCDEEMLSVYERIFGIEYDMPVTTEERRQTVLAYWDGLGRFNKTAIENVIRKCAGVEASVWWEDVSLYISFDNTESTDESTRQIKKILRRRMPAHIYYILRGLYYAGAMENEEIMRLWNITFHSRINFWGGILYDGTGFYDGSFFYNQKRRYGLGARMQYHAPIRFFKTFFYNGRYLYDGTKTYDEDGYVTYGLVLHVANNIKTTGKVEETQHLGISFHSRVPFKSRYCYDGAVLYDGSIYYGCEQVSELHGSVVHAFSTHTTETVEALVASRSKEIIRFDGAAIFDGTKTYNSFYREESLA